MCSSFVHLGSEMKNMATLCSVGGELLNDTGHTSSRETILKHNVSGIVLATSNTFIHALLETWAAIFISKFLLGILNVPLQNNEWLVVNQNNANCSV